VFKNSTNPRDLCLVGMRKPDLHVPEMVGGSTGALALLYPGQALKLAVGDVTGINRVRAIGL
jgi:hypothetical protein